MFHLAKISIAAAAPSAYSALKKSSTYIITGKCSSLLAMVVIKEPRQKRVQDMHNQTAKH